MALSRLYRLRSSSDIDYVYKKGVSYKTPFFRVLWKKSKTPMTIAFVVSKKIDKRAVVRNHIKRKGSAAFWAIRERWGGFHGAMVVSFFDSSKLASVQILQSSFEEVLRKIEG